jgi:hypothetical protein
LVNNVDGWINVFVNNFQDVEEGFNFVANIVFQVVYYDCQRKHIVDVKFLCFVIAFHV